MIRFIAIIILFFTVLALSPLLIDEKGYILIAMDETIIELTILSATIMFSLFVISAFILFKVLRGGFKISFKTWDMLAFASRRRGIANFNKGLAAYMLEDYQGAEQLFAKSAEPAKRQQSAYLLAAAASAKQKLDTNTNHYLTLLEQESAKSKTADLASVIVKVKLLMNQKSDDAYKRARLLIDENHKQIGHDARFLVLEVDLCLIEKRFESAVDYLSIVRKEKSINDETVQAWEAKAYYGAFNHIIRKQDQASLQDYWNSLGRKVKQREAILFAYCQVLAEQNITEPLIKLITPMLKKQPNDRFLKQLRSLPIKRSEPLIALVQKNLHDNRQSPQWLSCLGHLALMSEQWSMAEKAFGSLIKLEGQQYDKQDLQAFAKALTEEGQHQAANEVWVKVHAL
ncbi:heme biosynthesis HemY N-terminal domain-containing protein [Candidatus Colwellia aromaticivorans]|uniref:heme biosynthesis HemY N-terminal domain-containing protein n=1 Tax=Candidatus Colwellia aromaticivorans TaxID=2267621 RepID=UPI000DF1C376|nr:heme biosynthesis HemY N-terminal domain-containing protein [Candidatus Colwellia aromaticivorans]